MYRQFGSDDGSFGRYNCLFGKNGPAKTYISTDRTTVSVPVTGSGVRGTRGKRPLRITTWDRLDRRLRNRRPFPNDFLLRVQPNRLIDIFFGGPIRSYRRHESLNRKHTNGVLADRSPPCDYFPHTGLSAHVSHWASIRHYPRRPVAEVVGPHKDHRRRKLKKKS